MDRGQEGIVSKPATWTIAKLLTWATDWLGQQGSASPRLDAELLLADALSVDRLDLYLQFDRPCDATELAAFKGRVLRRAKAEPVAYILGSKGFHAIELEVGPGVLVPRPETEFLVDRALEVASELPRGPILDLCTGSGAIALAIAHAWRDIEDAPAIVASDVSPKALAYARRNADRLGLTERVHFIAAAGLAECIAHGRFAMILSNPPYVLADVIATLDRDVRDHEPKLALDGGPDGLDVLREIAENAADALLPGGVLAVELGSPGQGAEVVTLLADAGLDDAVFSAIGPGPTGIVEVRSPAVIPIRAVV